MEDWEGEDKGVGEEEKEGGEEVVVVVREGAMCAIRERVSERRVRGMVDCEEWSGGWVILMVLGLRWEEVVVWRRVVVVLVKEFALVNFRRGGWFFVRGGGGGWISPV